MNSPSDTLLAFMKEMHQWEEGCYLRSEQSIRGEIQYDETVVIGTSEYMNIFHKYCSSSKAVPREFFYDHPPDYDAGGEKITNEQPVSPDIVKLHTQQQYGYKKRHVYHLCQENGWKLFEKYILLDSGEVLKTDL